MTTTESIIEPGPLGYPLPAGIPPDLPPGRHCSRGNIIRHYVPDPEDVDLQGEEGLSQVMVTVWCGDVIGQLIRWVWKDDEGSEVSYEARIDGAEDPGGVCHVAAFSVDACRAIAYVSNELRYEWEIITGAHAVRGVVWQA
jgi:hypothetical protein